MIPRACCLLSLLVFTSTGTAFAENWIHVLVNDRDGEQVTVNLPISLITGAVALIPEDLRNESNEELEVSLNGLKMDWAQLQAFWQEVRSAPDETFVTVQTKDETIEVRKEGNDVLVRTVETSPSGTAVDSRLPLAVIDALLSGPEGRLDFNAALEALARSAPGNIVSVRDGDELVRIWIDDKNEIE